MKALHLLAAAVLAVSVAAHSQTASAPPTAAAPAVPTMTEGEVRKVDKEAGKITLRHAPIESLGMPTMTMVFRVADPTMLEQVKEGEKVRFLADRRNGAMILTRIEAAR